MTAIVFGVGFFVIAICLLALWLLDCQPTPTINPPIDFNPPFPSLRRRSPEEALKWPREDRLFLDDGFAPLVEAVRNASGRATCGTGHRQVSANPGDRSQRRWARVLS